MFFFMYFFQSQVIDTKARKIMSTCTMPETAPISALIHPATYVNKFLIGYSNGKLDLWNHSKSRIIHSFRCIHDFFTNSTSSSTSAITILEQSPACDVIGIGFEHGDILLVNIRLDKLLFSFKQTVGAVTSLSFRTDAVSDRFPFMASSGSDGRIYIWNLGSRRSSTDIQTQLSEMNGGRNTYDFDDDEDNKNNSSISLERKLDSVIEDAHSGRISKIHFLHGEPILITSSVDNSIKMWIFDSPDGSARLLRSRSGHSGFPTKIRYYGGLTNASKSDNPDGFSCELISAGSDSTLRLFNTAIDSQNVEMSQKPMLKKLRMLQRNERLSVVTGFDFSEARENNWGNLVTIHKNSCNTFVWRFKHRVITETILRQPFWLTNETKNSLDPMHHSTAVCVTSCGNFCVVGTRSGVIYVYNLQSGHTRGVFPVDADKVTLRAKEIAKRVSNPSNVLFAKREVQRDGMGGETHSLNPSKKQSQSTSTTAATPVVDEPEVVTKGHTAEVTGLFVDMANTTLVSCGLDGNVVFWDFMSHALLSVHATDSVSHLRLQGFREAGFVAVIGQDRVIRVFDISAQRLIRKFSHGHSREITDVSFSPDGRRLLSSSLDATVRVWDMPAGRCVSWLAFDAPVLSVTVSPSGEYLCLAQANKEGIFMYIDRSLYETVHFWTEPTAPMFVGDSLVLTESTGTSTGNADVEEDEEEDIEENDGFYFIVFLDISDSISSSSRIRDCT